MSIHTNQSRWNLRSLAALKGKERIAMLTAYDAVTAHCLDAAGVEILLVGDSMGNVVYGFESTLPVTMAMTLTHTAAVVRGSQRALVVADLPFLSYQCSIAEAVRNAGLCLQEAGAQAVKLEGASPFILEVISRLTSVGIPVMGHIGLTPQAVNQQGGFYTHGKSDASIEKLWAEAKALERAGCFSIVLECVTPSLAQEISQSIKPLTIGIGSGSVCDGEVLVINDLLGFTLGRSPKFAQPKMQLKEMVKAIGEEFVKDVKRVAVNQEAQRDIPGAN